MSTTTDLPQPATGDELGQIIAALKAGGPFPAGAIEKARQYREAITPLLIESLRQGMELARRGESGEDNTPFFALFLLGEFGAKEALPAILEAIALPKELLGELLSDAVTEVLDRVLAA